MTRVNRQKFRDQRGRVVRTRHLAEDDRADWIAESVQDNANPALARAMAPFLAELTIPQADAYRAVYREGLSTREAATYLGISQPALRERLDGAKVKIRKLLAERFGSEDFATIRKALTPSEDIGPDGSPAFVEAECRWCGKKNLALFRAFDDQRGILPWLLCPADAAKYETLRVHATAADGSIP